MPQTVKARPISLGVAKRKPLKAKQEVGPAQWELVFLIVGGIALIEGIALLLLVHRKK
jgi:hypothetical protein